MTNEQSPVTMPDVSSTPASPEAARASLEALRFERMEGRIGQDVYLQRAEYLQRAIDGEKVEPAVDPFSVTQEQRLQTQLDEAMAPAAPEAFRFEYELGFEHTPLTLELDREMRDVMSSAGIPQHIGGALFSAVDGVVSRFENADEATRQAQIDHVTHQLQAMWGEKFAERRDAVLDLVSKMAGKSDVIADIVENAPWALADIRVMEWLDQVVQRSARK